MVLQILHFHDGVMVSISLKQTCFPKQIHVSRVPLQNYRNYRKFAEDADCLKLHKPQPLTIELGKSLAH